MVIENKNGDGPLYPRKSLLEGAVIMTEERNQGEHHLVVVLREDQIDRIVQAVMAALNARGVE